MRRDLLACALGVASCAPAAPIAPPPVVVVPAASAMTSARPTDSTERLPGEALLLGNVQRMGDRVCTTPTSSEWVDVHLRAGLVKLEGNTRGLEALQGRAVLAYGKVGRVGAPLLPRESNVCMPIQRRSDWLSGVDGVILRRKPDVRISSFDVRTAHAVEPLALRVEGDALSLTVVNAVRVALEAVSIVVHYEGCFRKRQARSEQRHVGALAVGASEHVRVHARLQDPTSSSVETYAAVSVQLLASAPGLFVDLDLSLPSLGASVECPGR